MNKNLVRSLGLSVVLFVLPGVALAYCPPTRPPSLQQQCLDHEERERQQEAARARQREQEAARERQREQEAARERQQQEAARERQQQEAARERQREQEAARAQGLARERQQQEAQEKQRKHQEAERPRITERPGPKLPSLGQGAPLAPPHPSAQQQQQQPQQRNTQTIAIPGSPPQPSQASHNAQTPQTMPVSPAAQARTGTLPLTGNASTIPNATTMSNAPNTQQRQAGQAKVAPTSQSALLQQQRSAPPMPVITSASGASTNRTTPVNSVDTSTGGNPKPADTSGASTTTTSGSGKKAEKKITWGPLQYEAVAICRKQKRGTYQCFGPLDNDVLGGDTLERALSRQYCAGGTWAAGGPFLHDEQWEAYRCGHALGAGDYDLVKRYNLITAQRTYMCPQYQPSDGRCKTPYDGQDKR